MDEKTQVFNALQILAKASGSYVKGLDDLARNFTEPQVNAAVQILGGLLNHVYPDAAAKQEAPAAPQPPTDPRPAAKKKAVKA
jgi:hypothetical protein